MMDNTDLRPKILQERAGFIRMSSMRMTERQGEDVPSVILFHARYSTPIDAVSSSVAMNEPSIFDDVP